jgi:predicted Zn finger-like uncharacterized protein
MQIACPNCDTTYDVADSALGAGRNVRCTECSTVWFATAPEPVAAAAGAAPEPAAEMPPDPEPPSEPEAAEEIDWGSALQEQKVGGTAAAASEPSLDADGSPSLVPSDDTPYNFDHVASDSDEDMDARAARRAARGKKKKPPALRIQRPSWPTVILSLLTIIGAILGWRHDVVRAMPQTASLFARIGLPVNLRGLVFAEITTTKELNEGVPVLIVQGVISNVTKNGVDVPRLRFAMRDSNGLEVYTWTARPTSGSLGAGEALPFRTRLASPPAEGRDVFVRFSNRRDR